MREIIANLLDMLRRLADWLGEKRRRSRETKRRRKEDEYRDRLEDIE